MQNKPTITVHGLLTVIKSGEVLLSSVNASLIISEPSLTGYSHPWRLSPIKLPVAMAELNRLKDLSIEDEEGWFDIKFQDPENGQYLESKTFMHSLSYDQTVELQGVAPLPLHQYG